jgi:hypothetical protein
MNEEIRRRETRKRLMAQVIQQQSVTRQINTGIHLLLSTANPLASFT